MKLHRKKDTKNVKNRKQKICLVRFFTSSPNDYRCIKGILGFFFGFGLGMVFYYLVLLKLDLPIEYHRILSAVFIMAFAIGYAISNQVRCIILLVIPSLFSKNGRSYVGAFAIIYLLSGPAANIVKNLGEINRAISCGTELAKNITVARASIMLAPLHSIMDDMEDQSKRVSNVTSRVKTSFRPAEVEVYDENETKDLQKKTNELDKSQVNPADRNSAIEDKFGKQENSDQKSERVEAKYSKKTDYRCEDVFSMGVITCRRLFLETEQKCKKKIPVIGDLICWPMKLTIFCELARVIPSIAGINCDADDAVNPGFGESFQTAEASADALDSNFDVNMQYKLITNTEVLTKRTPEDICKEIAYEFQKKKERTDIVFKLLERILAFMFLRMLRGAYSYNKLYTSNFGHDNTYLTGYFHHIDKRRKHQNKMCLVPLKKLEKKVMTQPTALKMTAQEKGQFGNGSLVLVLKALAFGMVIFFDKVLYDILKIIKDNSRVKYEQKGMHSIDIKVHGTGAMSHVIRVLLHGMNQNHHIDQEVSNYKCLPSPIKTDSLLLLKILLLLITCWILLLGQAYALRLRRLIAGFFYRKREKKRILYLYNDMLKKRKGYLKYAKTLIKQRAREGKLEGEIGLLPSIAKRFRSCPRIQSILQKLAWKQLKCILCKESIGKKGVQCNTSKCYFAYCKHCWLEIGKNCYACRDDDDWTIDSSADFNFDHV